MKTTESIETKMYKHTELEHSSGEKVLRQNKSKKSTASTVNGEKLAKQQGLLTRAMVLRRLECHPATLHYRVTRGQLIPIKVAGKKYYSAAEVEQLRKYNPVRPKPHYSKRTLKQTEQPKQSLWSKIKSLFVSAAK